MATRRHPALVALGEHVRKVRKARGIPQEDSPAGSGLGRPCRGWVEHGERNLPPRNLMRIAAALGVVVGELFPPVQGFRSQLEYPAGGRREGEGALGTGARALSASPLPAGARVQ